MGSEALLRPACWLSYVVAHEGLRLKPVIDPPFAMREHLDDDPNDRALAVAQQAIDNDPGFRRRVANTAGEDEVGRAGYLWLHRPLGWAAEFQQLVVNDDARLNGQGDMVYGDSLPAQVESKLVMVDTDSGQSTNGEATSEIRVEAADHAGEGHGGEDVKTQSGLRPNSEANVIEDELSSLRGLVDRLARERRVVSTSVERVEKQMESSRHQPSGFDSDVYTLRSELETARSELDEARRERDSAVQHHSAALTRQLELEKELDLARELRADVEREHAEVDTTLIQVQEALVNAEGALIPLEQDRDDLAARVDVFSVHNEELAAELSRANQERMSDNRANEAVRQALELEIDALRLDKTELADRLAEVENELFATSSQLSLASTQATEAKALVEALTEEKIDLASLLADTESMLDTSRAELTGVKADAEAVAADLSNIKAHRDGLSTQVDDLHSSLTDALSNLARVRSTSDDDRAALKEVRIERDQLRLRASSMEQVEAGLEAKLSHMTAERDGAIARMDDLNLNLSDFEGQIAEVDEERRSLSDQLSQSRTQISDLERHRDDLGSEIDGLKGQLRSVEETRDSLLQQVEQLTAENAAIQDQLVESDRLRVETSESQGHALSELAQRLSLVENERSMLEGRLEEVEAELIETVTSFESGLIGGDGASAGRPNGESDSTWAIGDRNTVRLPLSRAGVRRTDRNGETAARADADEDVVDDVDDGSELDQAEVGSGADGNGAFGGRFSSEDRASEELVAEDHDIDADIDADADLEESLADATSIFGSAQLQGDSGDHEDDNDVGSDASMTKKHSWSLGPLLRGGGGRGRRDDSYGHDGEDLSPPTIEPGGGADEEDIDAIAAAIAEAAHGGRGDNFVSNGIDGDLPPLGADRGSTVGNGLADGHPGDDDLDAIGELISQTVTDFDPKGAQAMLGSSKRARGDLDHNEDGSSGLHAVTDGWTAVARGSGENGHPLRSGGRANGQAPPSIFNGSANGGPFGDADPFDRDISSNGGDHRHEGKGNGNGSMGAGRRQITVPDEILDDEIELARHVVSSPDVVLLVDGDSVAKMGWPSLPVAQQRDALVSYLADLSASTGAAPDVVFDGRIGEEESLPASRAVRIRLSTPPTEPAAALDELVDAYPEQWPIAVVTDEGALAASAVNRGAAVLSNGQLLDLFIAS